MTPVFGIAGRSGSGKTTLIEAMLPLLGAAGLAVSVIKHSHHDFQMEPPGKDSARFRLAGAREVMVASPFRYAIVHELRDAPEPSLAEQVARLAPADLVLVEGFKAADIPRIEVYRPALGKPPLHGDDPGFLAVVTDAELDTALPCLPLNDPAAVAAFIRRTVGRD
ncbi:Molybdopterin-guanine dinucleotide biosynthesis adapter protein [Achromobacter deleyi]|uniref:Molybdopterin-guanine dinucleotide biosynthesis adapter protein n=1 Tax=Achromobacter deleyi TaxID=1353891 RepID=A0A6S7AP82_9BURK|nr:MULTISPECIES: molybdopterin-guanine dinucleotide biosynthesis protein B [Achromobacter]CAB3741991.1 Molybdopterin-guanine dinucleotide biosynthesis adapter protein [Achromobacter deleyi]CAB3910619.1 Molybdopterin-guanine dinucleotide biosynthesis adapter protein [Achromobacter deleyi]CAB3919070.1 Molybdopterin-guanine dinucleotide biosynthesis adapter protein [Achromobacter deleyi]CAB3925757.1 Molybdopterin-guanine dinucleotide biosynthesis adapter protein [Achromobacter deleyi]